MSLLEFFVLNIVIVLSISLISSAYVRRYIIPGSGLASDTETIKLVKLYKPVFCNSSYIATAATENVTDYFNADMLLENPEASREVSAVLIKVINKCYKKHPNAKLAFIEKDSGPVGVIQLAALVSSRTGIPYVLVRPRRKVDALSVSGSLNEGDRIILVQDVLTTATQVLKAQDKLELFGANIVCVVSLFDREMEKLGEFTNLALGIESLLTMSMYKKYEKQVMQ